MDSGFTDASDTAKRLLDEVGRVVVGQRELVEGLLLGLLARGHVLVEGVPGVAKTTAVRTLAQVLGLGFRRVQFTPDLLPGDLLGTPVWVHDERRFELQLGPIFTPVLLADEINRAPAKVQSALLEAMEERQVTIGDRSFELPAPFFVMATQNPVELEGTYPLPEAEIDRFMLKILVGYPDADEERRIVARDGEGTPALRAVTDAAGVSEMQRQAAAVHVEPSVSDYAVRIARATRDPDAVGARIAGRPAGASVSLGASPRASLFLVRAARSRALLDGRHFATPHDVKRLAPAVLRHRLVLSYEAEADGIAADDVVKAVLDAVESP